MQRFSQLPRLRQRPRKSPQEPRGTSYSFLGQPLEVRTLATCACVFLLFRNSDPNDPYRSEAISDVGDQVDRWFEALETSIYETKLANWPPFYQSSPADRIYEHCSPRGHSPLLGQLSKPIDPSELYDLLQKLSRRLQNKPLEDSHWEKNRRLHPSTPDSTIRPNMLAPKEKASLAYNALVDDGGRPLYRIYIGKGAVWIELAHASGVGQEGLFRTGAGGRTLFGSNPPRRRLWGFWVRLCHILL
jgi:hypothetical protein